MLSFRRFYLAMLVVAGLFVSSATSRAVDPRLLPANTEVVFSLNIKQMLDSELVKSKQGGIQQIKAALDNLPDGGETMKYLKIMGFDPFTDLTSITIAHPGNEDPKEIFVVIDAVINAKKFAEAANTAAQNNPGSLRVSKFGTTPVYEIQLGGENVYAALVGGKSLVITATEEALKGAITRSTGEKIVATKIRELLKTAKDTQSANVTITGDAMGRMLKQAEGAGIPGVDKVGGSLAGITGLSAAITITKDINFQLGVGTKDEKSAKEIANNGTAGLAILNLMVAGGKQDPETQAMVEVLRSLRISSVGSNAVLTGSVSQENLEKIIKMIGKKAKG